METWPTRFDRTHTTRDIRDSYGGLGPDVQTGEKAAVAGRIRSIRDFGGLVFIAFSDQAGDLQLFISRSTLSPQSGPVLSQLDLGDWIGATGEVITTRRGELSIHVKRTIASCQMSCSPTRQVERASGYRATLPPPPPGPGGKSPEPSDLRDPFGGRSELRHQFHSRGFMEVDTPSSPPGRPAPPLVLFSLTTMPWT